MRTIAENIQAIRSSLHGNVKLVAVSKTKPVEDLLEAYHAGQRLFGENKAQEMAAKFRMLPADTEWHFIGHLQTNKVKMIAPFVALIHAVDSLKLLKVIDREAKACNRVIPCLLEFRIAREETKYGLSYEDACEILENPDFGELENVTMAGVMGMATFTGDMELVRSEFRLLSQIFDRIRQNYFSESAAFREISMGMSGDYLMAMEEGSTLVRIGSSIFGERQGTG